ncbi:pentatricopeptide repeat-containing protein [Pyrus ussuriensis x Pyrus communis]|uniref:Pentatricopeptide repeat-containing protein n=1 Tax=Pyrus ussuriensis x Pyrus communis TaxID=2448454 RepID=A0A5N5GVQ9_9ROSA|nr:pentatricopeptide repeat-containing protein [Pyrus ussuriensis x Pyrus communis]
MRETTICFQSLWMLWERFGKVKVHGFVVKTGIGFDAYVCNSLIDMVESFKQVFDEMPERNRLCWNVTISRYLRCRRFEEALDVFRGMRYESNEKPDEATVVSTISACTALKNLELGLVRQEKCLMVCARLAALGLWTSNICGLAMNGKTSKAIEFFSKMVQIGMKPDDFTFIVVLSACVHRGLVDEGPPPCPHSFCHGSHRHSRSKLAALFPSRPPASQKKERTCPHRVSNAGNNHLFSKPLDAWERFGKVKVHGFGVKTRIGFDAYVCNSLIDMVESFKHVFDEMPERNRLCWNVTISRCLRCRRFEEALDVFRGMRCESNEKPDEATVVSTISACTALSLRLLFTGCARLAALGQGEWIHRYIECNSSKIDAVVGTAVIEMYAKCGSIDRSLDFNHLWACNEWQDKQSNWVGYGGTRGGRPWWC